MEPITELFVWNEYQRAIQEQENRKVELETKSKQVLNTIEFRVANAKLTCASGRPPRHALVEAIRANPDGPSWNLNVRVMDDMNVQYTFPGEMTKPHREDFMRRLVTKYHGETLNRVFHANSWAFLNECGYQAITITIQKPTEEPDLLDLTMPDPFELSRVSTFRSPSK